MIVVTIASSVALMGDLFMGSDDVFGVDGNPVTLPWY
jgi:hypothetical protein